jgi:hypothetical protein
VSVLLVSLLPRLSRLVFGNHNIAWLEIPLCFVFVGSFSASRSAFFVDQQW